MSKGKVILGGPDLSGWALKEATADALLLAGDGEDSHVPHGRQVATRSQGPQSCSQKERNSGNTPNEVRQGL